MNTTNPSESLPPPPSLKKALTAGFDAISNHVWLVAFTFFLDLMLWLGPRVRLYALFQRFFDRPGSLAALGNPDFQKSFQEALQSFNFLGLLRAFPVGVPSLMVSRNPAESPLGPPINYEVGSFPSAVIFWLAINFIGIIAGTLYYFLVAQVVTTGKVVWSNLIRQFPITFVRITLLTMSWVLLLFMVGFPFSCIASFFLLSGIGVQQAVLFLALVGGGFLIWLLMPLIFSPHGIILDQLKVWGAVKKSFRVARMTLSTTSMLILVIVLISEGMSVLWSVPADTSWFTAIGILGHAFITTSLLASTFVYFRDASLWVGRVLEITRYSTA